MPSKNSKEEIYKKAINHGLEQMPAEVSVREFINA